MIHCLLDRELCIPCT